MKIDIDIEECHFRWEFKGLKEENPNHLNTSCYKSHEYFFLSFFLTLVFLKIYFCFDISVLSRFHSCQLTICVLNNSEQMKRWSRDKKSSKHLSAAPARRAESKLHQ